MHNVWVADSDPQPIFLAYGAEPFDYRVAPSVAGGGLPSPNFKRPVLADGIEQREEDCRHRHALPAPDG